MSKISAGVDVDDYGESLNEVETVLKKYNITLRDTEGNMRDLDDVLSDVAGMWDKLTTAQQNQISSAISGTRQANTFKTLMINYADAMNLAAEATDSAGTSEEKFATYTESIEAKVNSLKTAFTDLAQRTVNSDFVKILVDIGTAFLNMSEYIGGIIPTIGLLIGAIKTLKAVAAGTSAAFGGITLAISAFVAVINVIKSTQQAMEEARQEMVADMQDIQSEVNKLRDSFISLYNSQEETAESSLEKSWETLYELASRLRIEVDKLNKSYEYFTELSGKVETAALEEELVLSKDDYINAQKLLNESKLRSATGDYKGRVYGTAEEALSQIKDMLQNQDLRSDYRVAIEKYYKNLQNEIAQAQETITQYEQKQQLLTFKETYQEQINIAKSTYNKIANMSNAEAKKVAKSTLESLSMVIEKMKEDFPKLTDTIDETFSEIIEGYEEIIEEIPKAISNVSIQIKNSIKAEQTAYEELKEKREQQLTLEEKILAVQEKQQALAEAERKRVKVYRAGKGFVYESDFASVSSAQKELTSARQELEDYKASIKFDRETEALEELNEAFEQLFKNDEKFRDFVNSLGLSIEDLGDNFASMSSKLKSIFNQYLQSIGAENVNAYKALFGSSDTTTQSNIQSGAGYFETHHDGGIVGSPQSKFTSGKLKDDEIIAKLQKGETVLTKAGKNNLVKNLFNQASGSEIINVSNITLPNVSNAEQFVNELKSIGRMSLQKATSHR